MNIPLRMPRHGVAVEGDGDRWVSAKEAARYLGLKPSTLSGWRIKGIGPRYSASFGRDARYRLSDLQAFMEAGLVSNTVQAKQKRKGATPNETIGAHR